MPDQSNHSRKAQAELLLIGVVALAFAILELYIDSFERLVVWAAENESLLVTEIVTLAVIMSIGLSIYAFRRWREAVALESDKLRLQRSVAVERDANQLMRSYAEAVTAGQEAERRRLARELHDDTIQRLIVLNQRVELVAFDNAGTPAAADMKLMQVIIEETIGYLRHFIQELRPPHLDELGLVAALGSLAKETRERTKIFIEFIVHGDVVRQDEATELALYRIAQAALANIAQHAEADAVEVVLTFSAESIILTIKDDGIGFSARNERTFVKEGHFGLIGMRERAELIGASFDMQSQIGRGTTIRVTV